MKIPRIHNEPDILTRRKSKHYSASSAAQRPVAADIGGNMNTASHPLLTWFGRVPNHYELYPLPANIEPRNEHARIGVTGENGTVYIFEFDFTPPGVAFGLDPNISRRARVEYCKALHSDRYGNTCICR